MRSFMDGDYDDNVYFNNPVDYVASLSDPWFLHMLQHTLIRFTTGNGPWENSDPTYRMSEVLSARGIPHFVDNWGELGGHDWPYWKRQMISYADGMF